MNPTRRMRLPGKLIVGGCLLLLVGSMSLTAGWLFPADPWDMIAEPFLLPGEVPGLPLGSDFLGRDLAAMIFHAAGASLSIGLGSALLGLLIGAVLGALAGYFGARVDELVSRLIELFQVIPGFLLALVFVATLQPSWWVTCLAIALSSWPRVARLVRGELRSLRNSERVMAARSMGFGHLRILFIELLPSLATTLLVTGIMLVASSILTESGLAFIGLGDPNQLSWGAMLGDSREFLRTDMYLCLFPGLAVVVAIMGFNLLGDGLNVFLDPRQREHL